MSKPFSAARLRELLDYDSTTGEFFWKVKRCNMRAGERAGSAHTAGYVQIQVDGRNYLAHRLAWLHVTGRWPEQDIDHIDGCKTNNAIANLRDVSEVVNGHNRRGPNKNNADSGVIGVKRNRARWSAGITVNRVAKHLGTFDTPQQAQQAYDEAKIRAGLGPVPLRMGSCS